MKKSLLSMLLSLSLQGLACEDDSVAIRYLSAIDDMNWVQMNSLLSEDAHYTDPTMIYYDRSAIDLTGREDIVAFWRSASEDSGTSDIGYTVTACFETAGYHMVNLDIAITVSGKFWNVHKDEIVMPGKVISLIRVQDDTVIEHHDFVGYAGTESVIAELQQRYGTAREDSGQ